MIFEDFDKIFHRAAERKGSVRALEQRLVQPKSVEELKSIPDHRWLSALTLKVFQSGMNWQIVRNKWPAFEEVFWEFDIEKMGLIPPEMWEKKAKNPAIIRHLGRVMTIPENALMIQRIAREHGSFSNLIAEWPVDDIVGLWRFLKARGKRLGGRTAPYTLRLLGKDTFVITNDIDSYLRAYKIIDGSADTQKSLKAAQSVFNTWHQQSGRPLCQISQIIALSMGDNRV
ncbi:DNA-3-methyladenine glycosylase I [Veronia pacifica]|uniref:3-methyladenine DNA glycosylase n=1 Tax=Veronia pacifica TaxID=1080227 RepID=A0A1C3EI46_9GAMM|nr:DNA-3-methyladenine glycosylase I [Veronia pacifica]ODA32900.1 3-methyladenine DNA glycosylase [Veronia pacifica]